MIWQIFKAQRKKNNLLASFILAFNLLAALLEGASFALLLASFAFLAGETFSTAWLKYIPFKDQNPFLICLLGAILLQILRSAGMYLGQLMTTLLTLNIQQEAQKQIYERIFRMPFAQIAQFKKGDLMHHAASPPSFIPLLFDEYNRLVVCSCMLAAYLALMASISWSLTCINLVFFAVAAVLQKFFFKKITSASQLHANHITALSQQTAQSLEGMKVVHLFQRQEHILSKMHHTLQEIAHATLGMKKWNALIPCLNESLGILLVGISLLMGTWFLPVSLLFVYLTLTYRLGVRLQQIMSAKGVIASFDGQIHRLHEMLSKTADFPSPQGLIPHFEEALCFDNVSFQYPQKTQPSLKNISLCIPKKQIVALVGVSGAGKSSCIDLLLRLHTPTQGKITLDGKAIENYSLSAWRALFGVVPQEVFLFNDTIAENIRFGSLEAKEADIMEAAQMSGAHTFIQHLPQGYHTIIGERGYRLSGGEKQRIALAQALIRNPEILVLDEATSHLDSESENIVQEALARLQTRKTMVIVAHRLSTIQMADLIYVLENGRIIESGTHQDLLHLSGRYQMFWNLQTMPTQKIDTYQRLTQ